MKYGVLSPRVLIEEACRLGIQSLALTDINFSGAIPEMLRVAQDFDIHIAVGVDYRVRNQQKYVGIARNNMGLFDLNRHLSDHLHAKKDIVTAPNNKENIHIIYPINDYKDQALHEHEWVGISQADLYNARLRNKSIPKGKLVILQSATFRNKKDFNAHRLLRSIDQNSLLSMLDTAQEGLPTDLLYSPSQLDSIYALYPEALRNAQHIIADSNVTFDFNNHDRHNNLQVYTESSVEDNKLIRQLCQEGLKYRYNIITPEILARLDKELTMVEQKNFVSYFLINWRIVSHARSMGYFYVGRGSGANSLMAYLLRITDVDPIELDLYFERFINLFRKSPPDFDLDFSWQDREAMTQFIFDEFPHVSLLGTYSTFKDRAVLRELGKVFGLPPREIERAQDFRIETDKLGSLGQLVRQYTPLIINQPSHNSIHAGGILISNEHIHHYTATEMPPKGFQTTQFDMVTSEDVGIHKFDILSQRGLGKIKDSIEIIAQNRPDIGTVDIHDIPKFKHDPKVKELLRRGDAIGCFYIESPAMRMLLKKLQVDNYLGLVAASSVIRPGVAQSGMMREYINRVRNPERRKDAHPVLLEIMPDTYGVMVYQEDVIKVAHYFAKLTLGEADVLRRGMSGKYRSRKEFKAIEDKFFSNCKEIGHPDDLAKEIWRQIESFAGYAFAKGHSASYAVESYQSLYLKAYYPIEYMVATLNNGGGFYSWELYLHEAKLHGAIVESPCVNRSDAMTILSDKTIIMGLTRVRELEKKSIINILKARAQGGNFKDLYDCIHRANLSLEQSIILIRVNAFRYTQQSKKELLWNAHFLLNKSPKKDSLPELFSVQPKTFKLPQLTHHTHEDTFDEMELLGFPLASPFSLLKKDYPNMVKSKEFHQYIGKTIYTMGYLISIKNTKTKKRDRMNFGTFIDVDGHFIDTVHFPQIAAKYPFTGKGIYLIKGKVTEEFDFCTIEVIAMRREAFIDDPRYVDEHPKIKKKDQE